MGIAEFLEARIDEDEARASSGWARRGDSRWETDNYGRDLLTPSAVLAECAAKRKLVEDCARYEMYYGPKLFYVLAAVYKDHPEYQAEWAL